MKNLVEGKLYWGRNFVGAWVCSKQRFPPYRTRPFRPRTKDYFPFIGHALIGYKPPQANKWKTKKTKI